MITYPAEDAVGLAAAVEHVVVHRADVVAGMKRLDVADTLSQEAALLTPERERAAFGSEH